MKATNETDLKKGYSSHNAFPQRNKKTGNQVIVNMLFKYERYFGHDKIIEETESKKKGLNSYMSRLQKEKKLKTKSKWFHKKT